MWVHLGTLQRTNAKDAVKILLPILIILLAFLLQRIAGMGTMGARPIGNVFLAQEEQLHTRLFSSVFYPMNAEKAFIQIKI